MFLLYDEKVDLLFEQAERRNNATKQWDSWIQKICCYKQANQENVTGSFLSII